MKASFRLIFATLTIFCIDSYAENNVVDSLKMELKLAENDSVISQLYYDIGDYYYDYSALDSALHYYKKSIELAEKNNYKHLLANSLENIGIIYHIQGDIDIALEYYHKTLTIRKEIDDKPGLARSYNNIGIIHRSKSNYIEAIDYYQKSLDIYIELEDDDGIARAYNNFAIVYYDQANYDKSIRFMFEALKVNENIENNDGIAQCHNNIGSVYHKIENYELALEHYTEAKKIWKEIDNKRHLSSIYNNIGNLYYDAEEYNEALQYHYKSMEIKEVFPDKIGLSSSYTNIGNVFLKQGKYNKAINFFHKSLDIDREISDVRGEAVVLLNLAKLHITIIDSIPDSDFKKNLDKALYYGHESYNLAREIGALHPQNKAAEILKEAYEKSGNYKKALEYAKNFISTKKEIFNEEQTQALADMQTKYENEKKQLEIDNLNKQNELRKVELAHSEQLRQKQLFIIYAFVLGFILIAIFSFIIFILFVQKRKANILLADQKKQIELRNSELKQANEEILAQRDEIETQHTMVINQKDKIEDQKQKIDDSIRYAQRIQQAVVPSENELSELLGEHFVIFKPKDIVSGDFYWATRIKKWLIVTVADCTGHGVPGAFMSMLGISFLNEIVRKKEIINPAIILEDLRTQIIEALGQNENQDAQMDGIYMSIVAIDTETGKCLIAGASNSLWIARNNAIDIEENVNSKDKDVIDVFKGDKMPVAKSLKMYKFNVQQTKLHKGDRLYMFSDGITDQFGGPSGRKFMSKKFKELISKINKLNLTEQKEFLEKNIDEWMNPLECEPYEQIDDMTILCMAYN